MICGDLEIWGSAGTVERQTPATKSRDHQIDRTSPHHHITTSPDHQIPHAQIRLGAVSYLNTKPLVYGLENETALFSLRFDVPAQCAALLHEGRVDLGLIPAIEYLRGDYRIVPGVAIGSDGSIASVAVFSRVPIGDVKTLALDTARGRRSR